MTNETEHQIRQLSRSLGQRVTVSGDLHTISMLDGNDDLLPDGVVDVTVRVNVGAPRPEIVVLCGSTRFSETFRLQNLRLTLAGVIVLSIGYDGKSDADLAAAGMLGANPDKAALDELHKRKIDLADRVLVLNVGGYIGESTRSEIDYAIAHGVPVDYLEPASPAVEGAERDA